MQVQCLDTADYWQDLRVTTESQVTTYPASLTVAQ